MSEDSRDEYSRTAEPKDRGDSFPPPNNADTQAEQAAGLTEPKFDHHARYETELLTTEFGPPDGDGIFGRNPETRFKGRAGRDEIEGMLP
jgi:hypothetical protein